MKLSTPEEKTIVSLIFIFLLTIILIEVEFYNVNEGGANSFALLIIYTLGLGR